MRYREVREGEVTEVKEWRGECEVRKRGPVSMHYCEEGCRGGVRYTRGLQPLGTSSAKVTQPRLLTQLK